MFGKSFGTYTEINGQKGYLNANNDFFSEELLLKEFEKHKDGIPVIDMRHGKPTTLGCSSAVEHLTLDQNVEGSNPSTQPKVNILFIL